MKKMKNEKKNLETIWTIASHRFNKSLWTAIADYKTNPIENAPINHHNTENRKVMLYGGYRKTGGYIENILTKEMKTHYEL